VLSNSPQAFAEGQEKGKNKEFRFREKIIIQELKIEI
jgi:hypothetical protein